MSAFTLFDLLYRTARELGITVEGTATAGAQTTITDTVALLGVYDDDHFNGGTAFVLYDAGGAGAAPQGELGRISDFDKATGVVTFATLTAAVAAGDRYALTDNMFTRDILVSNINKALAEIPIPTLDDTIDTAGSTTSYTLPTGVLDQLIEVWIKRNTTTDNYQWRRFYDWYVQEDQTGTAKELIFKTQPPAAYDMRIKYWLPHPALYATTDKLRESIDINRAVLGATYHCWLWKRGQSSVVDPIIDQRIAEVGLRLEKIKRPFREHIKLATYGDIDG